MIAWAEMNREPSFIKPLILRQKIIGENPDLSLKNREDESRLKSKDKAVFKPQPKKRPVLKPPLFDTYVKMYFAGVVFDFYVRLFASFAHVYSLYTDTIALNFVDCNEFFAKPNLS